MKPLKALLCDLHGLAVASTLTLVGFLPFLGAWPSIPPRQGLELLACFFQMAWEQPPPLDPRSHERRLAKTHGQFGGGATLFGHGRFARRGRCSDWDDVARSRLPPDPGLGTADALAPWHSAMGIGTDLLAAGSCLGAAGQHGAYAGTNRACSFGFGALPRRRACSAAHVREL